MVVEQMDSMSEEIVREMIAKETYWFVVEQGI